MDPIIEFNSETPLAQLLCSHLYKLYCILKADPNSILILFKKLDHWSMNRIAIVKHFVSQKEPLAQPNCFISIFQKVYNDEDHNLRQSRCKWVHAPVYNISCNNYIAGGEEKYK